MRDIISLTKEYIETLLSLRVTVIKNTPESANSFVANFAPPVAEFSYNGEEVFDYFCKLSEKIVYDLEDCFFLKWIVIRLPDGLYEASPSFLIMGPYFSSNSTENLTQKALLRNNLKITYSTPLKMFYNTVPVCSTSKTISIAKTLLKNLYNITSEPDCKTIHPFGTDKPVSQAHFIEEEEHIFMAQTERRYELETKMQADITQGNSVGALQTWRILRVEMENIKRVRDPLRNAKNNCIIHNTILRKAVERAYVHPLYIDTLSNDITSKIEALNSVEELYKLQESMIGDYCKLVARHSLVKYTPMVRHTLNYINTHLSSDIHLPEIASAINVSPNYLSAVFNRETEISIIYQ